MGGGSNEQTVGWKYSLGLHLIISRAMDQVLALKFSDRIAWRGTANGGQQIRINKPNLFGGDEREGGISGRIDVLDGNPNQQQNDYLKSRDGFGDLTPAYRGVASLVFRQVYLGNNPYLKEIQVKTKCISKHGGNWYPEKSHINPEFRSEKNAIYIALDVSASMAGSRLDNAKTALNGFLEGLKGTRNSVRVVAFSGAVVSSMQRLRCRDSDYDALKSFVDGLTTGTATDYDAGVSQAAAFFDAVDDNDLQYSPFFSLTISGILHQINDLFGVGQARETARRVVLFITDGVPSPGTAEDAVATLAAIAGVEVYAFNIDLTDTTYTEMLDNTSSDGVPVVTGSNSNALLDVLAGAFLSHVDMNPAHILRALVVDKNLGGSGDDSDIGASFYAVADTLYDEGFGLSLVWDGTKTRDEFKREVERHIDGHMYEDRLTGRWEIKLVRNDYDTGTLTKFGDGGIGITEWVDANRPQQWELPNQIGIKYTKRETGDLASVTLTNLAALQQTGEVAPEPDEFSGITLHELADRVCQRELATRTTPLLTGSFWAQYAPADINLGTAILVEDARMGIPETVARVAAIDDSNGRDNRVLIRFGEDKYDLSDTALIVEEPVIEETDEALPSDARMVEEMPYYALVNRFGQSTVDDELAAEPDQGQFHATGNQPNGNHINAKVSVSNDAGATWLDKHVADFSPVATLQTGLSGEADDLTVDIDIASGIENVLTGTLCLIGSEYLRIDDMVLNDPVITVTFGRGCLDTVPVAHSVGDKVIFWQGLARTDDTRYLMTEVLDVKLRPQTGSDVLPVPDADTDQITFDSRAIRPYPVGKLQVEGSYAPSGVLPAVSSVTWAHRDRTAQTTGNPEDHTFGDIGPEAGVTYTVEVWAVLPKTDVFAEADFFAQPDIFYAENPTALVRSVDVGSATSWNFDEDVDFFAAADIFAQPDFFGKVGGRSGIAEFRVIAERDGYESWQTPRVRAHVLAPPTNLTAEAY